MDRSWPYSNFITNNDSIFLFCPDWDMNTEMPIKLLPHKSINFYGMLLANRTFQYKYFKVGFLYFKNMIELYNYTKKHNKAIGVKKYWSELIKLRGKLYGYELE